MVGTAEGLFGAVDEFPNPYAQERYGALVGLDDLKARIVAEAQVLIDPGGLVEWSKRHHGAVIPAVTDLQNRAALIVLAGDVGTGKSELAETVGDAIARALGIPVTLFPLSLTARGRGAVGEMTTLLTRAFDYVRQETGVRDKVGRPTSASILLVDEADAIAQSRSLAQMHHEDRAGVNALIRGIDDLRRDRLPVLTVMCTNRRDAIDPAVQRRAAAIFNFERPNETLRRRVFETFLEGAGLNEAQMIRLVQVSGVANGRPYGWTFSDLRQRFLPEVILDAMPGPLVGDRVVELATNFEPTPPFSGGEDG